MMEALASLSPAVLYGLVVTVSLLVGSFLNVVILRLPTRLMHEWQCQCRELLGVEENETEKPPASIVTSRSRCPHCGYQIAWYDNIPVLSWLFLRGRCRNCGGGISLRYPFVELLTAILSLIVIWQLGPTAAGLAGLALTWVLIAGAGIDIDHKLLPDQITLPLIWLGLILNMFGVFTDLESAVIGAIAGYLVLWLVFHLFRLATGKEGMGYGDFKLLSAIGAWFGWQVLPSIILIASLVGATVGISLMVMKKMGRDVPIAFGPFLAAAGWLILVTDGFLVVFWMVF